MGDIRIKKTNTVISEIESAIAEVNLMDIDIADNIYAVVGDTIQIFYDSIIISPIDKIKPYIKTTLGTRVYPNYWQFTPTSNDIGSHQITVQILDYNENVIKEKNVNIVVAQATNPDAKKVVLCVGDSLVEQGQIPIELSRRLKGTSGATSTPASLNLTNYSVLGRRTRYSGTVGFEGTSGYSFNNYISASSPAVRFTIADSSNVRLGDIFTVVDTLSNTQSFTVWGINTVVGQNDLFCLYRGIPDDPTKLSSTGTLTKIYGEGTATTLSYTALEILQYSPFLDENGDFDFTSYATAYCDGQIDCMIICLGTNDMSRYASSTDFHEVYDNAKIFINALFAEIPNCKVLLTNLVKSGDHAWGKYKRQLAQAKLNKQYKRIASEYANVYYIDDNAVFDHIHAYNTSTCPVNTRSAITEVYDTDGTHPSDVGYWQKADSWFRAVINLIR